MKLLRNKVPTVLYLHGFKSFPGDSIEQELSLCDKYKIISIQLDHLNPEKTYKEILEESKKADLVIGFSMGGYWASLIPDVDKLFINPAFLFPYILLHKTGSRNLFERYLNLSKNQFLGKSRALLIYWENDKTEPLSLFNTFYEGDVVKGLTSHVPNSREIKNIVINQILKML